MITATGWTRDTVDNLTLPQLDELSRYWNSSPPIHILLKAFVSDGDGQERPSSIPNESELMSIASAFNQ